MRAWVRACVRACVRSLEFFRRGLVNKNVNSHLRENLYTRRIITTRVSIACNLEPSGRNPIGQPLPSDTTDSVGVAGRRVPTIFIARIAISVAFANEIACNMIR